MQGDGRKKNPPSDQTLVVVDDVGTNSEKADDPVKGRRKGV